VKITTKVLLIALLLSAAAVSAAPAPNIVLIISDDQGWTDYGFMGHPEIRTPHIDKLSQEGIVFTRGYVPTALCRPSLMTLVTGLYAHQHGITGNDPSPKYADAKSSLYRERRAALIARIDRFDTLPELLAERGIVPEIKEREL